MEKFIKGALVFVGISFLSSCANLTPTKEVTEGYRIYDIKGETSLSKITSNLKAAVQKNADKARFTNDIPPSPLPEKAGRFKLTNPFANSNMGALMAQSGGVIKVPSCEGSVFSATSNQNFQGAENTTFFVCLMPYASGYHMDIYYTFTKVSGGVSAEALGAALAQSVVGDSSQFIPRTISALEKAVQDAGGTAELVDKYPQ